MQARKVFLRIFLMLLKLILGIVIALGIWQFGRFAYNFGYSLYNNETMSDPPGKDVVIVIPQDCPVSQAAKLLEAKGLIKDSRVFQVQERLSKYHGQMQAGNYVLNTSQTAEEMLAVLSGHGADLEEDSG